MNIQVIDDVCMKTCAIITETHLGTILSQLSYTELKKL